MFETIVTLVIGAVIGFVVGFLVKRNNAKLWEDKAELLDAKVLEAKAEVEKWKKEAAEYAAKLGIKT